MTGQPAIRVVRGNPDDVEVAALAAVLAVLAGSAADAREQAPPRGWRPARWRPAAGQWWLSGCP